MATTCSSDDADCILAQKKAQMMKESGIEPIATQDQSASDSDASKKPAKYVPFQIPKPDSSQTDTDQDTSDQSVQIQYNPGLKLFSSGKQNSQVQQGQVITPQTQVQRLEPKPLVVQPIIQPQPQPQPQNQTQVSIYR